MAASASDAEPAPVKKPEARLSPEIPIESDNSDSTGWFGKYKWWLAGGVVAVAGSLAAILASGSETESGGNNGVAGTSGDDITPPTQYRIDW